MTDYGAYGKAGAEEARVMEAGLAPGRMDEFLQDLARINRDLGLQFEVMRFRLPRRDENGTWNCRFQLPVLVTRYGQVEYEHGLPVRRMFDVRYVRAQILHGDYQSHTRLRLDRADPDEPVAVRIESVDWVVSTAEAEHAGLLIREGEAEPVPYLYAVAERRTGLLYPVASDTRLVLKPEDGDGKPGRLVDITVQRRESYSQSARRDPDDKPRSEEETLRRLEQDSRRLRAVLLERDSPRWRPVLEAAERLRAENREDYTAGQAR
ncbi:hypothetical protein [Bifidobacterium sp. SO4]|uniref:hypothetical protein n=1 Tax=Bifidobacterium sp. SO4 TaxID=2809030 RepID=UPI001BDBFB9F|nr:hypothetical protein [Bifidobacterium sp. SO4]MBT1171240.1 hypothetical protein [Bifidobacterium sp. SO4]